MTKGGTAPNTYRDLVTNFEGHEVTFRLVPSQLAAFACGRPLVWATVKFDEQNAKRVPSTRGVYAFVVQATDKPLPPHGYVMYAGKAGDGNHSLRKRFRDYCRDKKRPKRPGIHRLLNNWDGVLAFSYAEINDRAVPLEPIEHAINDALLPPYSDNDFSAGVRAALNAFPRR